MPVGMVNGYDKYRYCKLVSLNSVFILIVSKSIIDE